EFVDTGLRGGGVGRGGRVGGGGGKILRFGLAGQEIVPTSHANDCSAVTLKQSSRVSLAQRNAPKYKYFSDA
ncbi:MAG: hypothetical protein SAJ72_23765, partial [Jaaginema sp. PMC 1080.18]|nr:hypothetical protein [Jaaginema sp. PMC 1080.18]